jgi:D-alanine-D-alanine ligase
MKIGLAYDLKDQMERHQNQPDDELEEYDSPETVAAIAAELEKSGHETVHLGGGRNFLENVLKTTVDLVFNIAEGRGRYRSREAQIPGVLEMLGIPYVGSDPLTLSVCLDKPSAKKMAESGGVNTPRYQVVETLDDLSGFMRSPVRFPVVVKPAFEGSSMGIRQHSRVDKPDELFETVESVLQMYRQPALVEEFVAGIEITVGVVGNQSPQIVGVMEIVPQGGPDANFMYTLEVKRNWKQTVQYRCPPQLPESCIRQIEASALTMFKVLGCRDMARIDFRVDGDNQPYFIEANPLPGLSPLYSDLPIIGSLSGWDYPRLIKTILNSAMDRHGMAKPQNARRNSL